MATERPTSNRDVVHQAILDLSASNNIASRATIANATGLSMTIVDDHVKNLKADGKIVSPVNGVFEPVDQSTERPVSMTMLPGARVKLEIGDDVLDLTMREARCVAASLGGLALLFGR